MVLDSKKIAVGVSIICFFWVPSLGSGQDTLFYPDLPPLRFSILKSALIPGLGEFDLGRNNRGRLFSQIELLLWISLLESNRRVSLHESNLQSFAANHAGAKLKGKDNQYYINIGNFESMVAFNEAQQRLRQSGEVYSDKIRYFWMWDEEKNRLKYRRIRIQKETIRRVSQFVIGGLILNRIISVIDIRYLYKISERNSGLSFHSSWNIENYGPQLYATWQF